MLTKVICDSIAVLDTMSINVLDVVKKDNGKKLEKRAEECWKAQEERARHRVAITQSLQVALYHTVIPTAMRPHIASFIRVGFAPAAAPKRKSAMNIVATHRDRAAVTKNRADIRASWPMIDQLLVTDQFAWQCGELREFLEPLYPSISDKIDRTLPPGLREYLERMKVKELKALCRETPGARAMGKKSELVRELVVYANY